MQQKTFTEFKKEFYNRVPDLSIFDCMEFNILKVVLDGLKVNYLSRGLHVNNNFFCNGFLFYIKESLKAINDKNKLPKGNSHQKVLLFGSVRSSKICGKFKSVYYNKLIEYYKRINCYLFLGANVYEKLDFDYSMKNNEDVSFPFSNKDFTIRKNLLLTFNKINQLDFNKEELDNIKIAIYIFYKQYTFYNRFITKSEFKIAYLTCHYHKEGFILAAKRNNLLVYELQHGIIAKQDIFYNYPKELKLFRHKALFPDKILVFGSYWASVLLNGNCFDFNQIDVLGNYLTSNNNLLESEKQLFKTKFSYILITTQTKMSNHYATYIRFLSEYIKDNGLNYKIIVKNHHSEDVESYNEVYKFENVICSKSEVYSLFKIAEKHISIYSTTLYDALIYDLENYTLNSKGFEDYVSQIEDSGIAQKIETNQFPFKNPSINNKINIDDYYSEINYSSLFKF